MGVHVVSNLEELIRLKYPTIQEFTNECDLAPMTMKRAKSGKHRISVETVKIIANKLGIPKEKIMDVERTHKQKKSKYINKSHYYTVNINDNSNKYKVGEKIKVKYMGRSVIDGRIREYFFTTNTQNHISKCEFDISINIPIDNMLEISANKLATLKFEEEVILGVVDEQHMEIIDFYPKCRLINPGEEAIILLDYMINKLSNNKSISLRDNIISLGYNMIDTIVILSMKEGDKIGEYINKYLKEFRTIRQSLEFICESLLGNIYYGVCEEETLSQINILFNNIMLQKDLFINLSQLYKENNKTIDKKIEELILNSNKNSVKEIYSNEYWLFN